MTAGNRSVGPVWSRRWLPPEAGGGEERQPPEPALPTRPDRRKPIASQHIRRSPTVRFGAIGHLHAPFSAPWIRAPVRPHVGPSDRHDRTLTTAVTVRWSRYGIGTDFREKLMEAGNPPSWADASSASRPPQTDFGVTSPAIPRWPPCWDGRLLPLQFVRASSLRCAGSGGGRPVVDPLYTHDRTVTAVVGVRLCRHSCWSRRKRPRVDGFLGRYPWLGHRTDSLSESNSRQGRPRQPR